MQYWTTRPGPTVYYSPFWTIVVSSCLVFQTLQNLDMVFTRSQPRRITKITRIVDMIIFSITGIVSGVCLIVTSKLDSAALNFLAALNAISTICWYWVCRNDKIPHLSTASDTDVCLSTSGSKGARTVITDAIATSKRRPRGHVVKHIGSWFNVFLLVIHACILILSTAGSIESALSSSYSNP